jgi:uncharacterized repeat protein (TIGR03803 family)
LILASDGDFYGTAESGGGGFGGGPIFRITSSGAISTVYTFCAQPGCTDGDDPIAGLLQATSGKFYGTTTYGSSGNCPNGCGTVFGVSRDLGPFVSPLPVAGRVDAVVKILGNNLTGATGVTFNGTPASFSVKSANAISATVPAGATTGPVQVVTPSGTLTSNVNFRVEP